MHTRRVSVGAVRVVFWILAILSIPVTAFLILGSTVMSPVGALVGLVLMGPFTWFYTWLFKKNAGWPALAGRTWYWASLVWGGSTCMLFVILTAGVFDPLTYNLGIEQFSSSFGGGYPEEIGKALGIFLILLMSPQLDKPWHGFIVGAMVGLGFEVVENLTYGAMGALMHVDSDLAGAIKTWLLRSVAGPGLHVMFSAIAGFGIGWAVMSVRWSVAQRFRYSAGFIFVAFALHFLWNYLPSNLLGHVFTMGFTALVGYPLVVWMYRRCHQAAKTDYSVEPTKPLQTVSQLQNFRATSQRELR